MGYRLTRCDLSYTKTGFPQSFHTVLGMNGQIFVGNRTPTENSPQAILSQQRHIGTHDNKVTCQGRFSTKSYGRIPDTTRVPIAKAAATGFGFSRWIRLAVLAEQGPYLAAKCTAQINLSPCKAGSLTGSCQACHNPGWYS